MSSHPPRCAPGRARARGVRRPGRRRRLRTALDAHALSDGMVNAAVLPALVAAGYDRTIAEVRRRPAPAVAADPVAVPPLDEVLDVGEGWARLRPGAAVDLGGVGKGWLADRLAERLENAVPDPAARDGPPASATARRCASPTRGSPPAAAPGGGGPAAITSSIRGRGAPPPAGPTR
ncbi:MAG: hypothetical protein E6I76_01565 [Chloroflexi bacterium]|nr:MAG: hypothetical protein E6I76_01565 [Chloroflexota bacterium]